jgi:hypothetical protein
MEGLWRKINKWLVGNILMPGKAIEVPLDTGKVSLWDVDNQNRKVVTANTHFRIVDVLRNPTLLYRCRVCKSYGPFRCAECVKRLPEGEERLCSKPSCAHFIQNRLTAYCPEHIPRCKCSTMCKNKATFMCEHCRKLFGDHFRHQHPQNKDIEYCRNCYSSLFEECAVCKQLGSTHNLGKLRCAFKSQSMADPCGEPLCWEHGFQWKIWGPHNRGITFCERHKPLVCNTDPVDVLRMMITAPPPQQARSFSLANAFRLRRMLNRNRAAPLSFEQIGQALHALSREATSWERPAAQRYSETVRAFDRTLQNLPRKQEELLAQIRAFYEHTIGKETMQAIVTLNIVDRYVRPGQPDSFHIALYLNTSNKGPYIGRGGDIIKQLQAQLHLSRLDFWDATGRTPVRLD